MEVSGKEPLLTSQFRNLVSCLHCMGHLKTNSKQIIFPGDCADLPGLRTVVIKPERL